MSTKIKKPDSRKPATKKVAKKRGNLTPNEITPLIMAASKAFRIQENAGNVDSGETFDTWRKAQCLEAVGLPGITACNHIHFRPLLAYFQTLAGDDTQAFTSLMRTGQPTDNAEPGDTHEERGVLVSLIADALAAHMHLANTAEDALLAEAQSVHEIYQAGLPWDGSATSASFRAMLIRKAAITAKGKGPLTVGYVVYLTRQKTRRPDLTLGPDWKLGLAERCTVRQLTQIRDTLINRIAAVEGVGSSQTRNKSQRSPKAKAARSKKEISPRW
jgi:hypothetical protein